MAVETLGDVFQGGYTWLLDHDNTAGTIGVTVTDDGNPRLGTLVLTANVYDPPPNNQTPIGTVNSTDVVPFDNQGRHILYQNNALIGINLVPAPHQPPTSIYVEVFGTFTAAASHKALTFSG